MSSTLKGLFGGGEDKADQANQAAGGNPLGGLFGGGDADNARDFINRVQTGAPHEGFSNEEAVTRLAQAAPQASPEQLQRATRKAVERLPEDQRADFAKMLKERMAGVDRSGSVANKGNSVDDVTDMFSQVLGGGGGGMGGLLGGLLGGGGGGMLGGLLGGGNATTGTVNRSSGSTGGGGIDDMLGGLLGSTAGKAAIGGLAAMVLSELMDGKK